jgi:hypothetical protein
MNAIIVFVDVLVAVRIDVLLLLIIINNNNIMI